ncbi:hypothetical protein F383_25250 [Gossypium arboreum]|uniref:Uncharacterized protein n=1 Tax=Gossypium arboreum TaxID=29729 RepID=A0A0B0NZK1_GOSAR|nr:hypothetical protein F383_25250 [Gossypium arboreum]
MKRLWPSGMIYGKASAQYMSRLNRALAQIVLILCFHCLFVIGITH